MTLCGRLCFVGWSVGHNVKPRTSRRVEVSTRLVAVVAPGAALGHGSDRGLGNGLGCGFGLGYGYGYGYGHGR